MNYLYGKFNFYWQSAGLFHREARDLDFDEDTHGGERIWEDPLDWLSGGHGGVEFAFDFGLKLRVGLSSFTTFKSVTAGAGLTIMNFLVVDYAFESHPVFSPVHRVSVSFSPYLFSHSPRPGTTEATVRTTKVLTEESEETDAYEEMERVPDEPVEESVQEAPAESAPETSATESSTPEKEILRPPAPQTSVPLTYGTGEGEVGKMGVFLTFFVINRTTCIF